MFFKKKKTKGEIETKTKIILIETNIMKTHSDGTYVIENLSWIFKDLTRYTLFRSIVEDFAKEWDFTGRCLEIQEDGDYMYFTVPKGWELYRATCEIQDREEN